MSPIPTEHSNRQAQWHARGLSLLPVLVAILAIAPSAWGTTTSISNQPLATLPSLTKPNLLFVMDSSGSMASAYMPDNMSDSNAYGYWSAQCNGVAYEPPPVGSPGKITYPPPLDSTGTPYPNASLSATLDDGYNSSSGTVNIFTSGGGRNYYYTYSGSQPKMGWTYDTSGLVSNTFSTECFTAKSTALSVFTKVTVTAVSTEAQNFANWYSYYRKRYLLMRTAMGRAISTLDSNYRVGFSTIYDTHAQDGVTNFVDVNDFTSDQKTKFYSNLYTVMPSGGTNLPDALSEAGRYFAHKIAGQTEDPVQYACQRNFTLMSTDGYWNSNSKDYALDGTTRVGEQDAAETPPMKDAGTVTGSTTKTKFTAATTATYTSTAQTRKLKWTRNSVTSVAGANSSGSKVLPNCDKTGWYKVTTVTGQTASETQTRHSTAPESGTSTKTETVVKNASGAVTSDTTTTPVTTWTTPDPSTFTYVYTADTSGTPAADGTPIDPGTYTGGSSSTVCQNSAPASTGNSDSYVVSTDWGSVTYSNTNVTTGTWVAGVPIVTYSATGGSSDTLSDVAEYYYKTPLRSSALGNCTSGSGTGADLCTNIVPSVPGDSETWQHMNTYTIGLGTSGTIPYTPDNLKALTGDPTTTPATAPTLNWPTPNPSGDATNIDDLWHAALDGRGQYYSALSASQLSAAIADVVYKVQQVPGSGTAAATSSLQLIAGDDNRIYRASYTTGAWTGDLQAYTLEGSTATIGTTPVWSAQALLDAVADPTTRKIYFSNGSSLQPFTYSALTTASKNSYFDNFCSQTPQPSQCASLNTADLAVANSGANLVGYLIGKRTYEAVGATPPSGGTASIVYRKRDHLLGDIVDGAPVFVGKPPFSYADAGYADFVTAQKTRKKVVYVAANDGMLHAFSADVADGGAELWAYVPTFVMSNLYKLADTNYGALHQYYVDGAPVVADIKVGSTWKTILVGGLNDGGKGYYALDITDPGSPKLLWEFSDTNLGLSFGNPVVTKRADGTWVVAFASGYNNADGLGHLYIVDANSGTKLLDVATTAGSPTNPSGLSKINGWIEDATNNTSTRFYGGDLLGNVWRFDVDNLVLPHQAAMLLAKLQITSTTPQPITTQPQTAVVGSRAVVMVGTGRYLGTSDKADTTQQSVYGIADNLTATGWGDVRTGGAFVQQALSVVGNSASVTNVPVNFADPAVGGWYVDLPNTGSHSGERVATDMSMQFNTLAVATAIPKDEACKAGGSSWRYYFNVTNGGVITTGVAAGALWSDSSLIVGMGWVKDSSGNVRILFQNSDGQVQTDVPPTPPGGAAGAVQATSWRELTN